MKTYNAGGNWWLFEQFKLYYLRRFELIEARLNAGAWVGILGFPAYYVIWTYWFPQPYESLILRISGFVACLFLLPWPSLGHRLGKYYPAYVYVASVLTLPGFFAFMLLMNESNVVWMGSTMIALFVLPLFFDWRNLLVMTAAGVGIGVLGFELAHPDPVYPDQLIMYMPIFIFALLCGVLFDINDQSINEQRRKSMTAISANIAHEMRTPLLTVRSAANGILHYWPVLTRAYHQLEAEDLLDEEVEPEHLEAMNEALDHVVSEVDRMNAIVDMVLMNLRGAGQPQPMERLSITDTVNEALRRYHLDAGEESKLHLDLERDFEVEGRKLLIVHILFNLLKNAYFAIAEARKGQISIRLEPGEESHRLIFRDTATGIPEDVQRRIFEPFYTTRDTGTGVGLSFCFRAMEDMGGLIEMTSKEGEFTQFTLWFPVPGAETEEESPERASRRQTPA